MLDIGSTCRDRRGEDVRLRLGDRGRHHGRLGVLRRRRNCCGLAGVRIDRRDQDVRAGNVGRGKRLRRSGQSVGRVRAGLIGVTARPVVELRRQRRRDARQGLGRADHPRQLMPVDLEAAVGVQAADRHDLARIGQVSGVGPVPQRGDGPAAIVGHGHRAAGPVDLVGQARRQRAARPAGGVERGRLLRQHGVDALVAGDPGREGVAQRAADVAGAGLPGQRADRGRGVRAVVGPHQILERPVAGRVRRGTAGDGCVDRGRCDASRHRVLPGCREPDGKSTARPVARRNSPSTARFALDAGARRPGACQSQDANVSQPACLVTRRFIT